MVQYIFTPWRNRRELLAVRTQFYPQHHHQPTTPHNHATPSFSAAAYADTDGTTESGRQGTWQSERERKRKRNGPPPEHGAGDGEEDDDAQDGEYKQKAFAVARVSMWMQRGGCPHMVESTALLMAAILSEGGAGSGRGDGAERAARGYAVRAAYSAAFSR
jgi:ribosomal biogenesis protein LAS1